MSYFEGSNPIRQRMIEDMTMRRLSPKTQIGYIRGVKKLATFLKRSPEDATAEELRQFQLALAEQGTSNITINATLSGLTFLFHKSLNRPDVMLKVSTVPVPRKLPTVLSKEEVKQLIDATHSIEAERIIQYIESDLTWYGHKWPSRVLSRFGFLHPRTARHITAS